MKKSLFLLTAFLLVITSCRSEFRSNDSSSDSGSSKKVSVTRVCRPFTKVDLEGVADIYYTQSDKFSCRLEGPEKYVKRITLDFSDNTLTIDGPKQNINANSSKSKVKVYLTSPDIVEISNEGVGSFIANGKIDTDNMEISSDGVGEIHLKELVCDKLDASLDGVGDINLDKVDARYAELDLDGVGSMDIHFKRCDLVDADLSGVGSMNLSGRIDKINKNRGGIGKIKYSEGK